MIYPKRQIGKSEDEEKDDDDDDDETEIFLSCVEILRVAV
jgi:hypothetical protein